MSAAAWAVREPAGRGPSATRRRAVASARSPSKRSVVAAGTGTASAAGRASDGWAPADGGGSLMNGQPATAK